MLDTALAFFVIGMSLVFTYTNGLQDGSSVTAVSIACRAMTPARAVLLVSLCEFSGALFGGSAVADAVHSITNTPENSRLLPVLASGLLAAIVWNYVTKIYRFPSSSTHALFGGMLGALLAESGSHNIVWGQATLIHPTGFAKVLVSLITSPLLGFLAGYIMINVMVIVLAKASTAINEKLKYWQNFTVALLAFGHGANDPQKSMGIILLALHASGLYKSSVIPFWVRLATGIAIVLGVISLAPGIVKRVGSGIYKMRLLHGFVCEASSGMIIVASSIMGCPVSTSQVISSTVIGVGSGERLKGVHWLVARDILFSWLLTIPLTGGLALILYAFIFRWLTIGPR